MTNYQFPVIKYKKGATSSEWGLQHGESFRQGIKELVEIRTELMLKKNPALKKELDSLALAQFEVSKQFAPHLADELKHIAIGANLTLTDLVILNNYTDFRDIILPEEGCSTIHVQKNNEVLSGQTWDMHRSAKNYLSLIDVPKSENHDAMIILSLIGCVGLMGINTKNCLIGVNNINTANAKAGLIWPILVRKTLEANTLENMRHTLTHSPVTSGHNYLISSPLGGEHWEITPTHQERVGKVESKSSGYAFHTNHCLGKEIEKLEDKSSMSSTTFCRFDLLSKKVENVKDLNTLKGLLTDHEEFPKSICSHFENGAQDPSFTCGGGVADLNRNTAVFWRGCPLHDQDYVEYAVKHDGNEFQMTKTNG